jgi:hypothetical protein
LASIIYGAFILYESDANTPAKNNLIGMGVLRLLVSSGFLYICNVFAADTVYIAETANQPILPSFSVHFDNLKNRLTTNVS